MTTVKCRSLRDQLTVKSTFVALGGPPNGFPTRNYLKSFPRFDEFRVSHVPDSHHRCPPHSPGPVSNAEIVRRYLPSELHFDRATERATERAFQIEKLMGLRVERCEECGKSWGELLDRAGHTSIKQSQASAAVLAGRLGSPVWALAGAVTRDIRNIQVPHKPNVRILLVLDDGGAANPGHAVLRAVDGCKKHDVTEARRQLLELFKVSHAHPPL